MEMNDLPLEVIEAVKVLTNYLNRNNLTEARVSYLGGLKLVYYSEEKKFFSPISLDLMLAGKNDINNR